MPEPESPDLLIESVNRCVEAFRRQGNNHDQACKSFLAELPTLSGPAGIHAYLACIGKAMALGVIDLVDLGRYCHVAQLAMRAWKLAHPLPPNSNHFEIEGASGPSNLGTRKGPNPSSTPQNAHPLPPEGNRLVDDANRVGASGLPDFNAQKIIYKELRQKGIALPSNSHLRKNPMKALFFCSLAKELLGVLPPADNNRPPTTAVLPPRKPANAA